MKNPGAAEAYSSHSRATVKLLLSLKFLELCASHKGIYLQGQNVSQTSHVYQESTSTKKARRLAGDNERIVAGANE